MIEMRVFIARTYTYINVPNYKMFGAEISEIYLNIRVIEFLRNLEFRNWHAMRGGLMLPDSISEEKLEID